MRGLARICTTLASFGSSTGPFSCSMAQAWVSWVLTYGLMILSILPGRSIRVESTSYQPCGVSRRMKAVPRMSVMSSIFWPKDRRWATSTMARSALPYSRMSAQASIRIE
ncbi:hypothetical protein D3C78_1259940 [compost metagenome]